MFNNRRNLLKKALVASLLWRTAYENHGPLSFEFNEGLAKTHSAILGAAGVLFAGAAVVMAISL